MNVHVTGPLRTHAYFSDNSQGPLSSHWPQTAKLFILGLELLSGMWHISEPHHSCSLKEKILLPLWEALDSISVRQHLLVSTMMFLP